MKAKEQNIKLTYDGELLYKYRRNSRKYKKNYFEITLEPFRRKLSPVTDEQNFFLKNAEINNNLQKLIITLKEIQEIINTQLNRK